MIYFANASSPVVRAAMLRGEIGMMCTPGEGRDPEPYPKWAADNGCFGKGYPGDQGYLDWLSRHKAVAHRCWFATAPDVVGDAAATLARSRPFFAPIRALGYPVAFVAQDGISHTAVPWDEFDVLFLGGSDDFKLGPEGRRAAAAARRHGKRIHVGRVNSGKRLAYAQRLGAVSSDGTFLAWGPDKNLLRVRGWYEREGIRVPGPTVIKRRLAPELNLATPTHCKELPVAQSRRLRYETDLGAQIMRSYSIVHRAIEEYQPVAVLGLFSGGNDSTTFMHLMRRFIDHAVHVNTGIGIEATREFVRETCAGWNLPLIEQQYRVCKAILLFTDGLTDGMNFQN